MNLLAVGGVVSAETWPLVDYRNGAWAAEFALCSGSPTWSSPDTRVYPPMAA